MSWTLHSTTFDGETLAEARASSLRITLATGLADAASFFVAGDASDTPPFTERETVQIKLDGTTIFRGYVTGCESDAAGESEGWNVTLDGAGRILETCPYLVSQPITGEGTAYYGSDLTLGYNTAGERLNIADSITQILADTTARHGITTGSILSGFTVVAPSRTVSNLSVATAIRTVLAWVPDAVMWYEHAANTINIKRPAAMSVVTKSGAGDGVAQNTRDSGHRRRKVVDGVLITWDASVTVDGVEERDPFQDIAGDVSGPWIATASLPLNGGSFAVQKETPVVETIPEEPGDVTADFLIKHWPWLDALNIEDGQLGVTEVTQTIDEDTKQGRGDTPTRYPRYIIAGSVPVWHVGISVASVEVKITLVPGADFADNPALVNLFPGNEQSRVLTVMLKGTDATNRTYSNVNGGGDAEEPVAGLAATWLEALQSVQPAGTYRAVGAEVDSSIKPGLKLTLTGALPVTAGIVQTVDLDIDGGMTSVRYGPVGKLQPADLTQLARVASPRSGGGGLGNPTSRASAIPSGQVIKSGVPAAAVSEVIPAPATNYKWFACRLVPGTPEGVAVGEGRLYRHVNYEDGAGPLFSTGTIAAATLTLADVATQYVVLDLAATVEEFPTQALLTPAQDPETDPDVGFTVTADAQGTPPTSETIHGAQFKTSAVTLGTPTLAMKNAPEWDDIIIAEITKTAGIYTLKQRHEGAIFAAPPVWPQSLLYNW